MDTHVTRTDKDGRRYNRHDEEVIKCQNDCGRDTTMLGTKLCDLCWEELRDACEPEEDMIRRRFAQNAEQFDELMTIMLSLEEQQKSKIKQLKAEQDKTERLIKAVETTIHKCFPYPDLGCDGVLMVTLADYNDLADKFNILLERNQE